MLVRLLYNIGLYLILSLVMPMLKIHDEGMKFWFVVWVMAIFNIALFSKDRKQMLILTAALVFVPFLAAHSIDNLIGDTTNLYNVNYKVYVGDYLRHTYSCGHIYMVCAIPLSIYLSVTGKSKSVKPVLDGSIKEKFKTWLDS